MVMVLLLVQQLDPLAMLLLLVAYCYTILFWLVHS